MISEDKARNVYALRTSEPAYRGKRLYVTSASRFRIGQIIEVDESDYVVSSRAHKRHDGKFRYAVYPAW